jgi:hypothetical protein
VHSRIPLFVRKRKCTLRSYDSAAAFYEQLLMSVALIPLVLCKPKQDSLAIAQLITCARAMNSASRALCLPETQGKTNNIY